MFTAGTIPATLGRCIFLAFAIVAGLCSSASAQHFPDLPLPPPVAGAPAVLSVVPGRAVYLHLIHAEAKGRGVPADLADAVAHVESGYNPGAIGRDGERGLMQVMPPTAAGLGFRGTLVELADPATNIRLGVAYLARAWELAGGDLCRTLMKYRAGHNQERMSLLDVQYCRRATSHLVAIGSPLIGAVPSTEMNQSAAGKMHVIGQNVPKPARSAAESRRFWAEHEARVRAAEAGLPWKRRRVASPL